MATERERWLSAFHAANPGVTRRAWARGGSYARVAARVVEAVGAAARVLDLACGDGALLELLGPRAVGLDLSAAELALARGAVAQGRAQALPFADRAFDAAACHLAFMLFDDIEVVVGELARVLQPGAPFVALVGGGPTADGDDAFHAFARAMPSPSLRFGDRRASSEAGWRELFAGWGEVSFERWPIDLGGTFDEVWSFLATSYQLRDGERVRERMLAAFPGAYVPFTVVTYLATVRR
jgi:SAM-dependent methyltransferase